MNLTQLSDKAFEKTIQEAGRPIVVDFGASWCGPCRAIDPIVKEVAADYDGRLDVYKMDFDASHETAVKFKVQSIPTLLFFDDGELKDRVIGAVPKKVVLERVEALVT